MIITGLRIGILLFALLLPLPSNAQDDLDRFFGSYVGSGVAEFAATGETQIRDLDVTIEPYRTDGFQLAWITVVRGSEGQRTDPDVERREVEETFVPFEIDRGAEVFIRAPRGGIFTKAKLPNPLEGEPMRWASVNQDMLTVYSAGITEDGRLEMQIYRRVLTADGLDSSFVRLEDEKAVVRVEGHLVRTE